MSTTVAVTVDDALADVLARVREAGAGGGEVALSIPSASALFLTASEFRALKEAVERGRLAVSVRTADPLRLQLARMLGLDAITESQPAPAAVAARAPAPRRDAPRQRPAAAAPAPAAAAVPSAPPPPAASPSRPPPSPVQAEAADPSPMDRAVPSIPAAPGLDRPQSPPAADPPLPAPVAAPAVATVGPPSALVEAGAPGGVPATDPGAAWPDPPLVLDRPPRPSLRARLGAVPVVASRLRPGRPASPKATGTTPALLPAVPRGTDDVSAAGGAPDAESRIDAPVRATEAGPASASEAPPLPPPTTPGRRRLTGALPSWRARLGARPLAILIGLAVAAVAVAVAAVTLLLPRAEVAVELARAPVRAELLVDVTEDGASPSGGADLVVAAKPATVEVAFEGSIPTTGTRAEPDATAKGTLALRNPTDEELTVDEGTIVATEEGVEFAVAEAVDVPAADPETGEAGDATATVRALEPGTGGNVAAGALGGLLENGVYYANREGPAAGGTDRVVRVVAEADLETLRAQAEEAIPGLAEERFATELDGAAPVPATFEVGEGTDAFDREPGDEAETLGLRAVRPVTALAYEPDTLLSEAREGLRAKLAAEAPDGYAVAATAVELGTPEPVPGGEGDARFRLAGEAEAEAVLDDAERDELADRLAGKDAAAAEAILGAVDEIASFDVAYRPGWLPDRMPANGGRIAIEPGA